MEQTMKTTILFDLYGTLVYSTANNRAHKNLFSELNIHSEERKKMRTIAMKEDFASLEQFLERIAPQHNINISEYEQAIKNEVSQIKLYPETISVLKELQKKKYNNRFNI